VSGARRFAATLVGVSLLVGCSPGAPDIATTTSSQLRAVVQEIDTAAAAGHYAAAVALLDTLQSRLDQALAAGQVGADRGGQIQAAIDKVRGDLGALVQPSTPAPSPTATATPSPVTTKAGAGAGKHKGKD
jgi:ribosomal protein S20